MANGYVRLDNINDVLKNNRIAVYGTGFVAMKFYDLLVRDGLDKNIECFIVSKKETEQDRICGIRINSINEFKNMGSLVICVAVHEVNRDEIEKVLDSKKIDNYIWIYPYLYELALGSPLKRGIHVPVDRLVRQCHNYRIAVRFLAVENYFGKNCYGYDIYRKAQELSCGKISSEKRLKSFCRLIQSWKKEGYRADSKILIGENYELIDGVHRITLARYFEMKEVVCDVFANAAYYSEWIGSDVLLTRNRILEAGFSKEEIGIIENTYIRIREAGY